MMMSPPPLAVTTPRRALLTSERKASLLSASRERLNSHRKALASVLDETSRDEELAAENERVIQAAQAATAELTALRDELAASDETISSVSALLHMVGGDSFLIATAEAQNDIATAKVAQLEADLRSGEEELERRRKQSEGDAASIQQLRAETAQNTIEADRITALADTAHDEAEEVLARIDDAVERYRRVQKLTTETDNASDEQREAIAHLHKLMDETAADEQSASRIEEEAMATESKTARLLDELTNTVSSAHRSVRDSIAAHSAAESRAAKESETLKLRIDAARQSIEEHRIALLREESRTHEAKQLIDSIEWQEEKATLEATLASHRMRIAQLKNELALRPTAEEVPIRREALERQALTLSTELAGCKERLALSADSQAAQDRCQELRDTIEHTDLQIAEFERKVSQQQRAKRDAENAIAAWITEERPRHEAFHAKLESENRSLAADIADMEAKIAENERTSAYHAKCRAKWKEQQERWDAGLDTDSDEDDASAAASHSTALRDPSDLSAAAADDSAAVSAPRAGHVTVEIVSGAGANEAVTTMSVPKPTVSTYPAMVMGESGALMRLGEDDPAHPKHFHFFSVRMVQSVLGFFAKQSAKMARTPDPRPRVPTNVRAI